MSVDTSYEERSVWVQLVSLAVVLGGYFVVAGVMMRDGVPVLIAFLPLFVVAVVLLVIVLALGHILALFWGKPEGRDERDRLIEWRADSNASHVLGGGVLIAITGMVFEINNVWIAHLLFLLMLLSEVLKLTMQLVYYRRGV
jgi:hypothetical protein